MSLSSVPRWAGVLLLSAWSAACGPRLPDEVTLHELGAPPASLLEWGILSVADGRLVLADGVLPYDVATPLFSDYAHKLRTVWMPPGAAARYREGDELDLPVGTVLSKTFYYPRGSVPGDVLVRESAPGDFAGPGLDLSGLVLIETRLLVRHDEEWEPVTYVWNEDQTDATLSMAGDVVRLRLVRDAEGAPEAFPYGVPTRLECGSCHRPNHTTKELLPLGPKARHLNKEYAHYADGPANQLERWAETGYLIGAPDPTAAPHNAVWRPDARDDLDHRARSYLDANCGHCHNRVGPADTSGLFLDAGEVPARRLGVCKPPVAAGRGTGDRLFSIVPHRPEESILIYRMETNDPGERMPEIGRSTMHVEAVELLREWVRVAPGFEGESCGGGVGLVAGG